MKFSLLLLTLTLIVAIGCNKDKFTTAPQVEIISISPSTVGNGAIINLKGSYTDKEGDPDSLLFVYKWYNGTVAVKKDTFRYSLASLGLPAKVQEAEFIVAFQYNTTNPNGYITLPGAFPRDTTATMGVVLIDKGANRSNYAESKPIRLLKP